ncbi:MAG: ferrous iron transport protein B [Bacillota bacterium]
MLHCAKRGHAKRTGGRRLYALVGNPNVGKSVIFARLTGRYATVSNYPGTTVELTRGMTRDGAAEVLDTPGVNGLLPVSDDERVTRNVLLEHAPDLVVQVADTKNLVRTLLLTVPLAELGLPFVLALNMADEAAAAGMRVDHAKLADLIGAPVVSTTAVRGRGLVDLERALASAVPPTLAVDYPQAVEEAAAAVAAHLADVSVSPRGLALMLLAGDSDLVNWLQNQSNKAALAALDTANQMVRRQLGTSAAAAIAATRRRWVLQTAEGICSASPRISRNILETIGHVTMRPLTGIPIFIGVLWLVYLFVGVFGAGTLVDYLETVIFGQFINPWAEGLVRRHIPIPLIQDLIVGDYGILTMGITYAIAIVLPIVGTFFLIFGVLEDSGYIPRLAVMGNRIFRVIGLNGKAVLPMVLGLGCGTMATLTTRILETRRERIIATLLLALGIPCSAQLGVIFGLVSAASPGALLLVYGAVALHLLLVGYLAGKLMPGEGSDFVLEIPPIRLPQPINLLRKTYLRVEWFLMEAVPLFVIGTLIVFAMDRTGLLAALTRALEPVVIGLLGLPKEATVAFLLGFLRRDYGAVGLYELAKEGLLSPSQIVVAATTITLFVPCIAAFLVMIKERGHKVALATFGFVIVYAVLAGSAMRWVLTAVGY